MRSTLIGIGVNLLLVVVKATAGLLGHTYALIADAIESGMDVVSSALILVGLKAAAKPPDKNHPQGHGKAEPLATVVVAVFLFLAAYEIGRQSLSEIRHPHTLPAPWTLLVLIAVVIVKEVLARYIARIGGESGSGVVKADAQHQRSDVITSAAAFVGIVVALIGARLSPDPRWSSADDWAALLASGWIAWNGFGILRGALYELTDAHPDVELEAAVRRVSLTVPGVVGTDKCFVRKMGFDYFVELDVRMDRELPLYRAHEIAHAVQDAVRAQIADKRFTRVLVHPEPTLPA
ncbi:MAG: cation diffusion facilitator family transporter [Armatimonadota bacterium]